MDLWRAYKNYHATNESKIVNILKDQNKKTLFDKTKGDLETTIMLDDYFITDLDIWALMSYWNITTILFSTGKIKMAMVDNWLYLTANPEDDTDLSSMYEPLVFIRSPRMIEQNKYPSYSLIGSTYKIDQMGEIGQVIQETITKPDDHVQSLKHVLDKTQIIMKRRGRPKKE